MNIRLEIDNPTLIHQLSPQTVILATDAGALHVYDIRDSSVFLTQKPVRTYHPHQDYISSISPLAPTAASTSGFPKQWVSTGGSTLAVTDVRMGLVVKSQTQEDELLSSVFVGGLPSKPGRSTGEKVLVGNSSGVLTLWDRGRWDDQGERIIVDAGRGGGESLDAICVMPDGIGGGGKNVCVGVGDGTIRMFKLGPNKMIGQPLEHDDVESVVELGFDVGGRMISGGGQTVKVWQEQEWQDEEDSEGSDDSDIEDDMPIKHKMSDTDSSEDDKPIKKKKKAKGKKADDPRGESGVLAFKID